MAKKQPFQKWYGAHKDEYNRKRRERYHQNKEVRNAAIERAREYRRKQREKREKEDRWAIVNGKKVRVYDIIETAEKLGRSASTLRSWERNGVIPKPTLPGRVRKYTTNQINLMKKMVKKLDKLGNDRRAQSDVLHEQAMIIHDHWEQ